MNVKTYYDDGSLKVRSMVPEDAKVFYDTYLSYGWHPQLETYENYYKEQEASERIMFIPEFEGKVAGICTLVLKPSEGPLAGRDGRRSLISACSFICIRRESEIRSWT